MSEALPCGPIGSMRLADGPTGRSLGLPNSFGERAHAAATVPMFAMNRRRENKVDIEVAPQLSSVAGGRRPCHLLLLPATRSCLPLFQAFNVFWLGEERVWQWTIIFYRFVINAADLSAIYEMVDNEWRGNTSNRDWFRQTILLSDLFSLF